MKLVITEYEWSGLKCFRCPLCSFGRPDRLEVKSHIMVRHYDKLIELGIISDDRMPSDRTIREGRAPSVPLYDSNDKPVKAMPVRDRIKQEI